MFLSSIALACLAFSTHVSAQFDDGSGGYIYAATPLETGYLAIWSIFGLLYFIEIILSIVAIVAAGGHRSPYAYLINATIFAFLASLAAIAQDLISVNAASFPTASVIIASGVSLELFGNWAEILLFLSVISLLFNRHDTLYTASGGRSGKVHIVASIVLGIFAFILFVLGTADAAVLGALLSAEFGDESSFTFDNADTIDMLINAQRGITITYSAIFISSVVFVVAYSIVLFNAMNRAQISDKATKIALGAVVPLYIAYTVVRMAFTIQYQTVTFQTQDDFDVTNFTWALFTNFFYAAIVMTLVTMGMSRSMWINGVQPPAMMPTGQPMMTTQGWQQQSYPQQYYPQQYYYATPNAQQQQAYYYPSSWPQQQQQQQQEQQPHEQQLQVQQQSPPQPSAPELYSEAPSSVREIP